MRLSELCAGARRPLSALGALGAPLVAVNDRLARVAGDRPVACLDDPTLALDLLDAFDSAPDPALIGRVLDFLREQAGSAPLGTVGRAVTVRAAVTEYREKRLPQYESRDTRRAYTMWTRRLEETHGEDAIGALTTADLAAFVHTWMPALDDDDGGPIRGKGASSRYQGVAALRSVWTWLDDVGYADKTVAAKLPKPVPPPTSRRAFTWQEQALIRHIASTARDPLLALCVVMLAQRVLMRRCEIITVKISGVDLANGVVRFRGKKGRWHVRPMPPGLIAFLQVYIESRRPEGIDPATWARSDESLVRYRSTQEFPMGRPIGTGGYAAIQQRLRDMAPEVFNGDTCLHGYRNTGAEFLRKRYGEIVARTALGHEPDNPSWTYMKASSNELREALTVYEAWTDTPPPPTPPVTPKPGGDGPDGTPLFVPPLAAPLAA